MKGILIGACLLLAPMLYAQENAPQIPVTLVPNFFKLPEGTYFGEIPGIATDSKGNIYVFSRSNPYQTVAYGPTESQLFEFDKNGAFLREIGKGNPAAAFAHSVRIDAEDNIWTTDGGSDMVVEFNQKNQIVKVFGRRRESSSEDARPWGKPNPPLPPVDGEFRQVTDVAFDSRGNVYITDGDINSRVAKFDKDGNWVKSWGSPGTGPGQFNDLHSIVIDNNDNIYIADRRNDRVQVFDTDGNFKRMFSIKVPPDPLYHPPNGRAARSIVAPNGMCITKGPRQVIFIGESQGAGRVFKVTLDGKVLGTFGHGGRGAGEFSNAHSLACPTEDAVYVGQTDNWRADKLILHPIPNQ
jgi:DNA-binding beta-propeller fold protein YncE